MTEKTMKYQNSIAVAEMFDRAAKMLIGEPVDPPAKPGDAAAGYAAAPKPDEGDLVNEGGADGR